ncbi:Tetratricopeptide repeat protein 17-like [Oopsacas minuta]|uniref:Tetratricopeptide repeat protein 17-like n=1 Tax=Oopsacas minuta TaxID=111878 RepID=A0AAV7JVL9_9METZ|nr:Tetratricopeptide repeat protein 17-like [Oopsacas minuta]
MTHSSSLSLWVYGVFIFIGSNSLCVTHWKLDKDSKKVVPIETKDTPKHLAAGGYFQDDNEEIISTLKQRYKRVEADNIIESTDTHKKINEKCSVFPCDSEEDINTDINEIRTNKIDFEIRTLSRSDSIEDSVTETVLEQPDYEKKIPKTPWKSPVKGNEPFQEVGLNCGRPPKETRYDHLEGVKKRREHPPYPEPDVIMIFKKENSLESNEETLRKVERNLKEEMKRKPLTSNILNQVGNYWRIRGNTYLAIECFRKALSRKTDNADVLLNLARVLYNLNYQNDAAYLAKISLQVQSPEQNSWLQHFTLGEVLESMGKLQEARIHYDHAHRLNPSFELSDLALKRITATEERTSNPYTLIFIIILALSVLCIVYTLNSIPPDEEFLLAQAQLDLITQNHKVANGKNRKVNSVYKKTGK